MPDLAELQIVIKSGEAVVAKGRLDALTTSGAKAEKTVGALGTKSSRTAKSLQGMVTPLRTLTTLFAGIGIASTVGAMADFEQAMANVSAVSGATGQDLERLTEQAAELGRKTKFAASDAAAGMEFLARAGFKTNEILSALPDTLNLAAAGALDLGKAADIASNIMSGFNIEATEMTRVADVLALAAASANTTVEQLGDGMKFAAPVAAAFGQELEDVTAIMAALGDAGIQAGMAGTNIRQIMLALANPTSEAAATLERYGIALEEVSPASNNLVDIMMRLKQANIQTSDALKLFSSRTAGAFLAIQSMLPKVEELTVSLRDAEGTAQRMAKVMSDNLRGDILAMGSAFEGLILALGDNGASGAFRSFVQTITEGLRGLSENASRLIAIVEALALAFGVKLVAGMVAAVRAAVALRGALAVFGGPIVKTIAVLSAAFVFLSRDTKEAAAAQKEYEQALKKSNPLTEQAVVNSRQLSIEKLKEAINTKQAAQAIIQENIAKTKAAIAGTKQPASMLELARLRELGTAYGVLRGEIEQLIVKGTAPLSVGLKRVQKELVEAGKAGDKLGSSLSDTQKKAKDLTEQLRIENNQLGRMVAATAEGEMATRELNTQLEIENTLRELGIDAKSKEAEEIEKLIRSNAQLTEAVEENKDAQAEAISTAAKKQKASAKQAADIMIEPFKNAVRGIQDAFSRGFREMLDGEVNTFRDFGDVLLDIFKQTLAEMAAAAATQRFVLPAFGSIGGALGFPGSAAAGGGFGGGAALAGAGGALAIPGLGPMSTTSLKTAGFSLGAGMVSHLVTSGLLDRIGVNTNAGGNVGSIAGGGLGFLFGASGSLGGPVGTAIGVALGNVVGNALGNIFGAGSNNTQRLGFSTGVSGGIASPFGNIGISRERNINGAAVLESLVSIDKSIAEMLNAQQIATVRSALSGTSQRFDVNSFDNESFDVVKVRLTRIIDAVAQNTVASGLLNAIERDPGNISQLVSSAHEIINLISMFSNEGESLNSAEQAIEDINRQFDELAAVSKKLGINFDVATKKAKALDDLRLEFSQSIEDQILAITDPLASALKANSIIEKERLDNAITLEANILQVERLNALERVKILKQYATSATSVFAQSNKGLEDFLQSLKTGAIGGLSGTTRSANADTRFNELLEASRSDAEARAELVNFLPQLVDIKREQLGSTAGFFEFTSFLDSTLRNLVGQEDTVSTLNDVGSAISDGNNAIIDTLQEENKLLREQLIGLRADINLLLSNSTSDYQVSSL